MKRRWRLLGVAGALVLAAAVAPVAYIEVGCRAPLTGVAVDRAATPLLPAGDRRPLAKTFLTYPEWHIVYEAEAFARHLTAGGRPSAFDYRAQVTQFWASYCAVNRLTRGDPDAAAAKVTIYTIGLSFSAELAVKAAYENSLGRLFEWASGWTGADDRYAARVQRAYGRFLHETPWYRFPFGAALHGLWQTREPNLHARHAERRVALSAEYGAKALYAKAIDAATGATVGRDELTLRAVVRAAPATLRAIDPRLKRVGTLPGGLTVVEMPRYQQFNDLVAKLAARRIALVEIAGNRAILVTLLLPPNAAAPAGPVFAMPADASGWRRLGIAVPVVALTQTFADAAARGGRVEHVYDY